MSAASDRGRRFAFGVSRLLDRWWQRRHPEPEMCAACGSTMTRKHRCGAY